MAHILNVRSEEADNESEIELVPDIRSDDIEFSNCNPYDGEYESMSPEIFSALSAGKKECLEILRSDGKSMACFKSDGKTSVLHVAAGWGHLEIVKSLVLKYCPSLLVEPDSNGQLSLHVAARAGHSDVVEAFIGLFTDNFSEEEKERLNLYVVKDINGDTPLHLA